MPAREVLIVEDEPHIAANLEQLLLRVAPESQVLAKLNSVEATVSWLQKGQPDLIFLDIQLSDGLSFAIFRQVEVSAPVIFTTAYDQYALQAFQVNSIAYLLKPINEEALRKSLSKLENLQQQQTGRQLDYETLSQLIQGEKPAYQKRFMVYAGDKLKSIYASNIAFAFSSQKSTFITTFSSTTYALEQSLDKLEARLDPEVFFRVNRQFIVHIEAIEEMHLLTKSRIQLSLKPAPEEQPIVSLSRTSSFRKWLDQ